MIRLRDHQRVWAIKWHDLRSLTTSQKAWELTLSLPWLIAALVSFQLGWIAIGAGSSFFFFLAALRQAHGAQHYTLGIGRRPQDWLLFLLSTVMVTSLHALQATHLHHHRVCLGPSDVESATARMPWWKALLSGPWFIVFLNWSGYKMAKATKKRWIRAEWLCSVAWVVAVFLVGPTGLQWLVTAMIVGECFTGFFAVWTVHHDCDAETEIARTQRGWLKNLVSYEMFFHVEHHLFPAVPTVRLPELAARLDEVIPQLQAKQVF